MDSARKTTTQSDWLSLGRAMVVLGIRTRHSVMVLAIKGELVVKIEELSERVFVSRDSIEKYLAKQPVDRSQLSVAL